MNQNSEVSSTTSRRIKIHEMSSRRNRRQRNQDMNEFVQNGLTNQKLQQEILEEFVMNLLADEKLEQRKLIEFVMSSLMNQKLEQENMKEFMVESLMVQKLKQDGDMTDQNVNQSRTTENDSERDVHRVRIQAKVETIWLFDMGADAHVMPKHVWCNVEKSKWTRSWSHG